MNAVIPLSLDAWGWNDEWRRAFEPYPPALAPARVVAHHRGRWIVVVADGDRGASTSGRFRHEAEDLPAVGDWVAVRAVGEREVRIEAVLPRRSAFRRRAAGSRTEAQVIASNVDTLIVTTSLNGDLNARRLERYTAMAHESGANPVVVLTKADLADPAAAAAAADGVRADLRVPVVTLSAHTGAGIELLAPWLTPGSTVALVGSSGVGKSTLLNVLAGEVLMTTREIREDDARGRHTTTHRELFRLPSGVLLLDTPGMRELGLWDAADGVDATFAAIAELAEACRFRDCRHEREPGCAVQAAIERGDLDARRLQSYRRLARELLEAPPPALRREAARRFAKHVRNASADSMARKTFRFDE